MTSPLPLPSWFGSPWKGVSTAPGAALSLLVAAGMTLSSASAAVVIVAPTETTTGSLEITEDILFVLTSGGFPSSLVFDEYTSSNGEVITTYTDLNVPLKFTLNGVLVTSVFASGFGDNVTSPNHDFTSKDGFIKTLGFPEVFAGDLLILKASSYILSKTNPAQGVFNPQATQTFTGTTFMTNSAASRISSNGQAVPECGSAILLVSAGGLMVARRTRRSRK